MMALTGFDLYHAHTALLKRHTELSLRRRLSAYERDELVEVASALQHTKTALLEATGVSEELNAQFGMIPVLAKLRGEWDGTTPYPWHSHSIGSV